MTFKRPTQDNIFITRNGAYKAGVAALKRFGLASFEVIGLYQHTEKDLSQTAGYVTLLKNRAGDLIRYASGDDLAPA